MSATPVPKTATEDMDEFAVIQRQLFVDLVTSLKSSDVSSEQLCQTVHKNHRLGHKMSHHYVKCFRTICENRLDETLKEVKDNENYLLNNGLMSESIDHIIQKQMKIKETNEAIVEKTRDLNAIESEESRSRLVRQVLTADENEVNFETIKSQLKFDDQKSSL